MGFTVLYPLQKYLYEYKIIKSVPIIFAVLIGLVAVVQWFVFRKHLESWWIAGNIAGGAILGGLTYFLYYEQDWWGQDKLFSIWAITNFVLGAILSRLFS